MHRRIRKYACMRICVWVARRVYAVTYTHMYTTETQASIDFMCVAIDLWQQQKFLAFTAKPKDQKNS